MRVIRSLPVLTGSQRRQALVGLCFIALLGCLSCRSKDVVAELERAQGSVTRDYAAQVGAWSEAQPGAEFRVGDGIKTAHAADAVLELDDGTKAILQEDTLLRFLATPPEAKGPGLDVETGSATLAVGERPLELQTTVGAATLEPGTRLAIAPRQSGLSFVVQVGLARFETVTGVQELAPGKILEIEIGGAVIEKEKEVGQPPARAAPAEPELVEQLPTVAASITGTAARVRDPAGEGWRALAAGEHQLATGATLELAPSTQVELTAGTQRALLDGPGLFVLGRPDATLLRANSGRIVVQRAAGAVALQVPGGNVAVPAMTTASLEVGTKDGTTIAVQAHQLDVIGEQRSETLLAGESATLSPTGELTLAGRGPAYADMEVAAGESFVVHDPQPPTAIRFVFGDACPNGSVVELRGRSDTAPLASSRGERSANLLLGAGRHRYRVRCIEELGIAQTAKLYSTVNVLRDPGTGVPARLPPSTRVDTDGRTYTVIYQNLLPEILVAWPKAPQAPAYGLLVRSRRGERTLDSAKPRHKFQSGELGEGEHQLQFSAVDQQSAVTKLVIRFDNAAPTARIGAPMDSSFAAGESVGVSGVAVAEWAVSIGSEAVKLDPQGRFDTRTSAPSSQRALQIRFSHPERSVHYYLRRARGAAP